VFWIAFVLLVPCPRRLAIGTPASYRGV
jgi:hypothetical protein